MRIGVYNDNLLPEMGGAGRFEYEVTRALLAYRDTTHQFVTVSTQEHPDCDGTNHVTLVSPRRVGKWESRLRRLTRIRISPVPTHTQSLRKAGIDLLYSPSPIMPTTEVPYVVTCWDLQHRLQPFFPEVSIVGCKWDHRERDYRRILPRAAATIVGTQIGKSEVEHFYGVAAARIAIVPFPTSEGLLDITPSQPDWSPTSPFVFYPAQFWPHKNHMTLLNAIKHLADSGQHVSAVFSGGDVRGQASTLNYMQEMATQLGIGDRVVFPGFIPDTHLRWAYENALALVYPSLFGPDNLPPLEAFLLKCPVIASDLAGAREQLGEAAILVDPCNESEYANAIQRLANSQSTRDTLIERGQERAACRTVTQYAARLISVFDELSLYFRCWRNTDLDA